MPYALSGDGNTIVVGNVVEDAIQVFIRDSQHNWSRQAFIQGPVPATFGAFGEKVAISHDGNRILVGTNRGPIYVFERDAGQWRQAHVIQGGPSVLALISAWTVAISPDGSSIGVPVFMRRRSVGVHVYKFPAPAPTDGNAWPNCVRPSRRDLNSPRTTMGSAGRCL
jgi:hypothetical protein